MDDFTKSRILICDDSITNVVVLSALVQEDPNITADTTTDPCQVESKLEIHDYDLLILDLEMPNMSGFEVMACVRKLKKIDELPILIITGRQELEIRNKALSEGASDFTTKPFDQTEVCLRVSNLLKVRQALKIQKYHNDLLEQKVEQRTLELSKTTDNLIHCMAVAGDLRDTETALHVVRVGKYAGALARLIGLPPEIAFMIEKTAPMHDIGKIGIPDRILLKEGKLNDDEKNTMEQHTCFGEKIFGTNDSLMIQMAKSIALNHHEQWDGSGYCSGLTGESIPIEGRITTIADVFDALTTKRPYKEAWTVDVAVQHLQDGAGSAFDPNLIDVFVKNLPEMVHIMEEYSD